MSKELNAYKYLDSVKEIFDESLQAATALLKEKGEKCYIAISDWNDQAEGIFTDDDDNLAMLSIFGVGLNEDGVLCVGGTVDNIGYGHGEEDFPQTWTDAKELEPFCYPSIYRFVAEYIESAITKEEADKIAEGYWDNEGDEF